MEIAHMLPSGRTCQATQLPLPLGWEVALLDGVVPVVDYDLSIRFLPWLHEDGTPVVPAILLSSQEPADLFEESEEELSDDELEWIENTVPMNAWENVLEELNTALGELLDVDPEDIELPDAPVYCEFCKHVLVEEPAIRIRYGTLEHDPDSRRPPGSPVGQFEEGGGIEVMCMSCMQLIITNVDNLWDNPRM